MARIIARSLIKQYCLVRLEKSNRSKGNLCQIISRIGHSVRSALINISAKLYHLAIKTVKSAYPEVAMTF